MAIVTLISNDNFQYAPTTNGVGNGYKLLGAGQYDPSKNDTTVDFNTDDAVPVSNTSDGVVSNLNGIKVGVGNQTYAQYIANNGTNATVSSPDINGGAPTEMLVFMGTSSDESGSAQGNWNGTTTGGQNVAAQLDLEVVTLYGYDPATGQTVVLGHQTVGKKIDSDGDGQVDDPNYAASLYNPDAGGNTAFAGLSSQYGKPIAGVKPSDMTTRPMPCFTTGMMIETDRGEVAVEDLKIGDMVRTLDNGFQPIRVIKSSTTVSIGENAPVVFEKGAIGNDRELVVSQKHNMHTGSIDKAYLHPYIAEHYGDHLVHALSLVNNTNIRLRNEIKPVTYYHIMLDQHELLFCHGTVSESWHPIRRAMRRFATDSETRAEIMRLFPEINHNNEKNTPAAREHAPLFGIAAEQKIAKLKARGIDV